MGRAEAPTTGEVAPGMKGAWLGILAYRWVALTWMVAQALIVWTDFRSPYIAAIALLVTVAWNAWFTLTRAWERPLERGIDLGLAFALLAISGFVMDEGTAGHGSPFFATAYPAAAALTVGAGSGVGAGLGAGAALSVALLLSRLANHISLRELTPDDWINLVNGAIYFLAAGGAAGVVSRVLARAEVERGRAVSEAAVARERAVRIAEREALGREIHDSVLQALALVGKRGRELASSPIVPPAEVRALVELAIEQERELRALLGETPEEPPPGTVALRTVLRAAAFGIEGVSFTVNAAGTCWMPAQGVEALSGAVRQALDNVIRHARASSVTVFAEEHDGDILVSVRDDGLGFQYDEERLAREGKMGMLRSMKGRIEAMGGRMRVLSAPGRGTEIEFRVPLSVGASDG
jgi:signal transduction histidine kinase